MNKGPFSSVLPTAVVHGFWKWLFPSTVVWVSLTGDAMWWNLGAYSTPTGTVVTNKVLTGAKLRHGPEKAKQPCRGVAVFCSVPAPLWGRNWFAMIKMLPPSTPLLTCSAKGWTRPWKSVSVRGKEGLAVSKRLPPPPPQSLLAHGRASLLRTGGILIITKQNGLS